MSEQLYYTFSAIGSGSTSGERISAQSPGLGLASSKRVQALRRYLSYKLPAGADLKTSVEAAPVSLVLVRTEYEVAPQELMHDRILSHRKYAGKDAVGRPGNFFTHAIIQPEVASPQTRTDEPISAFDAISLWKSSFWKTSEDQIAVKGTQLPSLEPEELSRHFGGQPNFSSYDWQAAVADWLPQVFAAFLMLKKLNKTQLFIAAPADGVATFIWCISRCLPRTLTLMQDLTFSTYEYEIAKSTTTIAGTCWLPPAHHSGPFIPQNELPAQYYQPLPTNPVLAINCYTQRQTPFEIDEQISKFTQFATQSLLQNDLQQVDTILTQAENRGCQEVDDFLTLFRIQQEPPTKQLVREILASPQLWPCLQYPNILDELIALIRDKNWQTWWEEQGRMQLQRMYQQAKKLPQSEETATLSTLADRVMRELFQALTIDHEKWATYWDQLLNDISSPSYNLAAWATLPQHLSQLPYTKTYQLWWQHSGKKTAQELYLIVSTYVARPEIPQLTDGLRAWSQKATNYVRSAWGQQHNTEMAFWLDILQTIQPPTKGSQDWQVLLNDLHNMLEGKLPVHWCKWEIYKTLLVSWSVVLSPPQHLPAEWLTLAWNFLPRLLDTSDVPDGWKKFALEDRIQQFQGQATDKLPSSDIAKCSPLVHEVLAELIQRDDNGRKQAVMFCTSLLQQGYGPRNNLLAYILPGLFPHQDQITHIAKAANLRPEELNMFMEETLYNTLKSQQDIPDWLIPHLENYLFNFQVYTLNPDHQEIPPDKRDRMSDILEILVSRNQMLPEHLRPYIFCWYTIRDFFFRPIFHPGKLQVICKHIKAITLSETMYQELNQEIIDFISSHVETELEVGRAIDIFGEVFFSNQHGTLPSHVLLLKEMVRFYSQRTQRSYSLQKITMYIKVVIGEINTLANFNVEQTKREQFVYECLDSLLVSVNKNQLKDFQTAQWPPAITKQWEAYKVQRPTSRPAEKTQPTPYASSPKPYRPDPTNQLGYNQAFSASNPQPLILGSSQVKSPRQQANAYTPPMNNTNQPPTATSDKDKSLLGKMFNRQESIEDMVKAFYKAFESRRADKIAAAYKDVIDSKLSEEQKIVAKISKQLIDAMHAYNADKSILNRDILVECYTYINESRYNYILYYPEMDEFVQRFNKEVRKQQKK